MPRSPTAKFYGLHACEALARARPKTVHRAFFEARVAPQFSALSKLLAKRRRPYRVVDADELAKVAGSRHHEGVCLVADPLPPAKLDDARRTARRILFLDGVGNPHNVGALMRTVAHFGRGALVASKELPSPSGATARVAEGAAETVPVVRLDDPARGLQTLGEAGFSRVATVVKDGEPLFETELPERCVFLIGAERDGLGASTLAAADLRVTIPGTGDVESLNVAAACAILLAEHARRHG